MGQSDCRFGQTEGSAPAPSHSFHLETARDFEETLERQSPS